ncbi:MAG: hypothetical protein AB1689_18610 [Thermodesulfobacteriota bacterium]
MATNIRLLLRTIPSLPRTIPLLLGMAVGLLLGPQPSFAIQTGASLSLIPSNSGPFISNGQTFTVEVRANNTSTNTLPPDTNPVPATITGPITIGFGCVDCECATNNDNHLAFLPGAATGCDVKDAAVTGCALGVGQTLVISIAGSGLEVPAGGSVSVATVTFVTQNIPPPPSVVQPVTLRGFTEPCGVTACRVANGVPDIGACVSCEAQGCTKIFFSSAPDGDCPHPCPNKITCRQSGNPDRFEVHGIPATPPGFDPPGFPFSIDLTKGLPPMLLAVNPPFPIVLPAGSLVSQGDCFTYQDASADDVGGIFLAKACKRDDRPNAHRIDVVSYTQGLCSALNTSQFAIGQLQCLTFAVDIGGITFSPGPLAWERKSFGWQRTALTGPPFCP